MPRTIWVSSPDVPRRRSAIDQPPLPRADDSRFTAPAYYDHPPPRAPRPRVKEPDRFTGQDPSKLEPFILQCLVYFNSEPAAYVDEATKINTAISFFDNLALHFVSPALMQTTPPELLRSWSAFIASLNRMFGDHNSNREAARRISEMTMKDSNHANRYLINFFHYVTLSNYNETALADSLYRGLPDRLKDEISCTGRPDSVLELRKLILNIDDRHWERYNKRRICPATTTTPTAAKPPSSTTSTTPSAPRSTSTQATCLWPDRQGSWDRCARDHLKWRLLSARVHTVSS